MKKIFLIVPLVFFSFLLAVLNDGSNDYTEAMLPLTLSGNVTVRYVVIGNSVTLSSNNTANSNTRTFEINGISYKNSGAGSVTVSGDDRYYIYFDSKNTATSVTLTGTNDWITNQTHTPISLPYSQTGTTSAFYETLTTAYVDSIVSSGCDMVLINNADYTNQTVTSLPAKQDSKYYIYYGSPASGSPSLSVTPYTPKLNVKLFLEGSLW